MTTKKKNTTAKDMDFLSKDMSKEENIKAALDAADVVQPPGQPRAKKHEPTIEADKATAVAQQALEKRGNIDFKIKAGTDKVRSGNNKNTSINDGSREGLKVQQVRLKIDSLTKE